MEISCGDHCGVYTFFQTCWSRGAAIGNYYPGYSALTTLLLIITISVFENGSLWLIGPGLNAITLRFSTIAIPEFPMQFC